VILRKILVSILEHNGISFQSLILSVLFYLLVSERFTRNALTILFSRTERFSPGAHPTPLSSMLCIPHRFFNYPQKKRTGSYLLSMALCPDIQTNTLLHCRDLQIINVKNFSRISTIHAFSLAHIQRHSLSASRDKELPTFSNNQTIISPSLSHCKNNMARIVERQAQTYRDEAAGWTGINS